MALTNTGSEAEPVEQSSHPEIEQHSTKVLMLGALGVVYGDIGTSPIYAFREALVASSGGEVADRGDILGVLSLIVWALTIIVTIKYIFFVLRADNRGEGGTLSLMALARGSFADALGDHPGHRHCRRGAVLRRRHHHAGDLGAVGGRRHEGRHAGLRALCRAADAGHPGDPVFGAALRHRRRGAVFGPVTAVWFLALGLSGLCHIVDDPEVLWAVNPHYIVAFLINSPDVAFVTIGAIFLAVTGAEALYADLGHFGRKPIVLAWLAIVFPCLLLNYFGQGAFVLAHERRGRPSVLRDEPGLDADADGRAGDGGDGDRQPGGDHRRLFADPAGGAAQPAAALDILHTSETQSGQIYMPQVNMLLALVRHAAGGRLRQIEQARRPPTASRSPARCW